MTTTARWTGAALGVLLLVSFVFFSLPLDQAGYDQSDELFYLAGGLNTHETGNFVVPTYQGQVRMQKPPLNYWLIALSYRAFGVGAWQGRLPGALAGAGSLALTAWLGFLLFRSRRSSLYGAAALAGCHLFFAQVHSATTDAVLAFFVLLSFCGFAAALFDQRRWGVPLAWLGMAAAMLQKGPVWAMIPLVVVGAWMWLCGRRAGASWAQVFSLPSILLFLAAVLPWPILLFKRLSEGQVVPTVAHELLIHLVPRPWEMVTGFTVTLVRLFNGMLPWSLLGLYYWKRGARDSRTVLLALWGLGFAVLFALFMVLQRSRYLVPLTPPLAVLCGHALAELQSDPAGRGLSWRLFTGAVNLSFVGLALYGATLVAAARLVIKTSASLAVGVTACAGALGALSVVWFLRRRDPGGVAWVLAAALGLAAVQTVAQFSWMDAYQGSPAYTLAKEHLRGTAEGGDVAGIGLQRGERAWAWLGAARSFPQYGPEEAGAAPLPWGEASNHRALLLSADALAQMPDDLRARYAEEASLSAPYLELPPLWFFEWEKTKARWSRPWRRLVLLRRLS